MNFIVDAQLPPALAEWLRAHGETAQHVYEFGRVDAPDAEIWAIALERQAIVITRDRDFAEQAGVRRPAPKVVWIRLGNLRTQDLLQVFEARWSTIRTELESGALVVQLL